MNSTLVELAKFPGLRFHFTETEFRPEFHGKWNPFIDRRGLAANARLWSIKKLVFGYHEDYVFVEFHGNSWLDTFLVSYECWWTFCYEDLIFPHTPANWLKEGF